MLDAEILSLQSVDDYATIKVQSNIPKSTLECIRLIEGSNMFFRKEVQHRLIANPFGTNLMSKIEANFLPKKK